MSRVKLAGLAWMLGAICYYVSATDFLKFAACDITDIWCAIGKPLYDVGIVALQGSLFLVAAGLGVVGIGLLLLPDEAYEQLVRGLGL